MVTINTVETARRCADRRPRAGSLREVSYVVVRTGRLDGSFEPRAKIRLARVTSPSASTALIDPCCACGWRSASRASARAALALARVGAWLPIRRSRRRSPRPVGLDRAHPRTTASPLLHGSGRCPKKAWLQRRLPELRKAKRAAGIEPATLAWKFVRFCAESGVVVAFVESLTPRLSPYRTLRNRTRRHRLSCCDAGPRG